MSRNLAPIDLSHLNKLNDWPRLIEEVKEVSTTKKPRILKVHSETLAILMPVGTGQRSYRQKRTIWTNYDPKRVRAALKTSAGALQGVDREELLSDLAVQRGQESTGRPF